MKNDFDEGQVDPKQFVNLFHNSKIKSMKTPDWAEIDCPHCSEKIEPNGLRGIKLCLNARNVGDLAVEFHCKSCGIGNTVYLAEGVANCSEFADFIKNETKALSNPVVEEEMFKLGYNNLMTEYEQELQEQFNSKEANENGNDKKGKL